MAVVRGFKRVQTCGDLRRVRHQQSHLAKDRIGEVVVDEVSDRSELSLPNVDVSLVLVPVDAHVADFVAQFDREGESFVALRAPDHETSTLPFLVFEIKLGVGSGNIRD